MNWLDIVLIIFLIFSVIGGIAGGLIKAVFNLAGLIVGVVLAGRFYTALGDRLPFISDEKIAHIVAFVIIFIIVIIIASILGSIITKAVSAIMLGWINRLGGAVLGFFMGAIFLAAILTIWIKFLGDNSSISNSLIASFFLDRFPIVLGFLPSEFDMVRNFFGK
jgi:membrane protein required for colicin V production